jgi:serine/threonine protein kinase
MLNRLQASLADRYRIERELGRGGMARVFLAHDLKHDRPVALKVLHPEAAAHIRQTLQLDPNYAQAHLRLGLVQIQQRRYPEAIASIQRAIDLGAFYPHAAAGLAFAYAVSRNREAATRIVDDLKRRSARELVPPFTIGVAYAGLGDAARGIEC